MRKLVSTLMAVTLMLVSATACAERITPSKNYVTKKVNVGSFNAISTSSSVDVIYTQSSGGQDVEIYAPDNLVDYIDVRVEGGVLKVGFKSPRNLFKPLKTKQEIINSHNPNHWIISEIPHIKWFTEPHGRKMFTKFYRRLATEQKLLRRSEEVIQIGKMTIKFKGIGIPIR